jgi:hypothetical protein
MIASELGDAMSRLAEEAASHSETRRVLAQALEELAACEPEALEAVAPGPEEHLCFIAGSEGYRLLAFNGPLPEVGDDYRLGEAMYVVTRIGRSPLPFDARRCVYLLASPRSTMPHL